MSESEHRIVFESLGAFALGALPDDERTRAAAHIATCPVCAEDAAALERAATRLIDVVPSREPSPELRDRIMAVVESEATLLRAASTPRPRPARTSTRPRLAAWRSPGSMRWVAAGAALLVAGAILGAVLPSGGGPATRTLEAQVGRGQAWVVTKGGDAKLVIAGLPAPTGDKVYEVWVQHGSGPAQPAARNPADATFVVRSGQVDIPGHLARGDRVLVTAEPAGGSRQPTGVPVVVTARE
jgi:anti-sigma-K factor RskA